MGTELQHNQYLITNSIILVTDYSIISETNLEHNLYFLVSWMFSVTDLFTPYHCNTNSFCSSPLFTAVFEPFLKAYIERFKYKSITTDDWKAFLYEFFNDKVHILFLSHQTQTSDFIYANYSFVDYDKRR